MGNAIVVLVLIVIVYLAARSSLKHFKGEGGCCGGGGEVKPLKKTLEGPVIGEKIIRIEGMHCENCKNSVERQLNRIEGAAARVNLRKKEAAVRLDRPVEDDALRAAVEAAGFAVAGIEERR